MPKIKKPEAGDVLGPPSSEAKALSAELKRDADAIAEESGQVSEAVQLQAELEAEDKVVADLKKALEEEDQEVVQLREKLKRRREERAELQAQLSVDDEELMYGALNRPVLGAKRKVPSNLTTVMFHRNWKRYYKGDRAGFSKKLADRLVAAGVAVHADSPAKRAFHASRKGS